MTGQRNTAPHWRLAVSLFALSSALLATAGQQYLHLDFLIFPGVVLGLHLFLLSARHYTLSLVQAAVHLFVSISLITAGWYVAVRLFLAVFQFLSTQSAVPVRLAEISTNAMTLAAIAGFPAGLLGGCTVGLALASAAPARLIFSLLWRSLLMGAIAGSVTTLAWYISRGLGWSDFLQLVLLFGVWQWLVMLTLFSRVSRA